MVLTLIVILRMNLVDADTSLNSALMTCHHFKLKKVCCVAEL